MDLGFERGGGMDLAFDAGWAVDLGIDKGDGIDLRLDTCGDIDLGLEIGGMDLGCEALGRADSGGGVGALTDAFTRWLLDRARSEGTTGLEEAGG